MLLQEVWLASYAERLSSAFRPIGLPSASGAEAVVPRAGCSLRRASAGWAALCAPEFHAFAASAPAWRIWEGDGLAGKGVLTVELGRGERRINVVNAHLQSQYSGQDYSEVREAQLGELAKVVSKIHPSVPAIVAGI